jgi:apolipoprotein N-acyltransferase
MLQSQGRAVQKEESGGAAPMPWHRSVWFLGLASAAVYWAALPPLDLGFLGWVATAGWLLLIRDAQLPGRHPYRWVWLSGFVFWLAALHWLFLPNAGTAIGCVFLSAYLACYLPAFIAVSRTAVHRLHVPLMVAAPVVWTGLELVRGHLLTGITLGSLAHTQYRWLPLIQLSDVVGAYGVTFVVLFATACLARMVPWEGRRLAWWPLLPAAAIVAATLGYGAMRQNAEPAALAEPNGPCRVALIQGSIDITLKYDPKMREHIHQQYIELSREAVKNGNVDLVVWPETMLREPWITCDPDAKTPEGWPKSREAFIEAATRDGERGREAVASLARALDAAVLVGVDRIHYGPQGPQAFNSAVYADRQGRVLGRYDKMQPVLFGEFIPLADRFPWLHEIIPIPWNLSPGLGATCFEVGSMRLCPSICYESILPHLIRRQVAELTAASQTPDVLINLTNDGWFFGSAELDMHLICGAFRAIEMRKPMLIAANTGFSAWIDGDGRILKQGPRRATGIVTADAACDGRSSLYLRFGDWFAGLCLIASAAFVFAGLVVGARKWLAARRSARSGGHGA